MVGVVGSPWWDGGSGGILDIHGVLTDDDKAFFRKQREERFGSKLEEVRRACEPCAAGTAMARGRVIACPGSAEVGW